MPENARNTTARTFLLACGHKRMTFQSPARNASLYCIECEKDSKVVEEAK